MLSLTEQQCSASCIHSQGSIVSHQAAEEPKAVIALPADCQIAQATARRLHRVHGSAVWCIAHTIKSCSWWQA